MDAGEVPRGSQGSVTTLRALLDRYDEEVRPLLRGAEGERYRIKRIGEAPFCDLAVDELRPAHFATYRNARLKVAKPQTVKHELALFGRIITLAQKEWGLVLKVHPLKQVALPAVENARDRRLEAGEMERLLKALEASRGSLLAPAVHLAIETGMRRGELLGLAWKRIDYANRIAFLPITKNGRSRQVPLSDKALEVLKGLPQGQRDDLVLPISGNALRLAWVRAVKRAGLKDLRFHDLRHEAISRYAEMGLTTSELSLISGHRDLRMLSRYTHLRPTELAQKLAGRSWEAERQQAQQR